MTDCQANSLWVDGSTVDDPSIFTYPVNMTSDNCNVMTYNRDIQGEDCGSSFGYICQFACPLMCPTPPPTIANGNFVWDNLDKFEGDNIS